MYAYVFHIILKASLLSYNPQGHVEMQHKAK